MKIKILCPEPNNFSQRGLEYVSEFAQLTAKIISQGEIEKIAPEIEAYIRDLLDNEVLEEVEDLVMPPQEEA